VQDSNALDRVEINSFVLVDRLYFVSLANLCFLHLLNQLRRFTFFNMGFIQRDITDLMRSSLRLLYSINGVLVSFRLGFGLNRVDLSLLCLLFLSLFDHHHSLLGRVLLSFEATFSFLHRP